MTTLSWFDAIQHCQASGKNYVLVTLLDTAGSTPRAAGTKMIITDDMIHDTVGGGHLEWEITRRAREFLASGSEGQNIEHYPLSSKLGQCCGGATIVLFEVFINHGQKLTIFGAGHVAKALVAILEKLPLQITWIDQRADMFESAQLSDNVAIKVSDDPCEIFKNIEVSTWVVVLTHNHQLDFDLVKAAMNNEQVTYLGMIGSNTKARRFRERLKHREYSPEQIERLICPIGLDTIPGKRPVEVAVSIAAQVIQLLNENTKGEKSSDKKRQWIATKQLLELQ